MVWPKYSSIEISTINKILKSGKVNYWTGKYGKLLEKKFSSLVNKKYALSVSNATVGLEYALRCLNFKKNDEIIVTPRSYYSSASCIIQAGAKPIFADIDIVSQNISYESIKNNITKKTKAIICVNLGGNPAELDKIKFLSKKNDIFLIEDCSQAHGAIYKNKYVGSYGDISIWSFCNDKIISSGGEGGIVCIKNKDIFKKFWSFRDIGKNYEKFHTPSSGNYFRWLHDGVGSNFRLTELQSALAYLQLKNLKKTLSLRNKISNEIISILTNFKWLRIFENSDLAYSARYRLNVSLNQDFIKNKFNAKDIISILNKSYFICNEGPCPLIYEEIGFKSVKFRAKNIINAIKLKNNNISFFIDPTESIKNLNRNKRLIYKTFKKFESKLINDK